MTITRCDLCVFWEAPEGKRRGHRDDVLGACHRYAPSPTMPGHWYALMQFVVQAVNWPEDEKFPDWEEGETDVDWPRTTGSSWCGDFKAKTASW